MTKKLIIAEKKSVADDISKALNLKTKETGFIEGEKYVVTWAIGHLLELKSPEEIDKSINIYKKNT